MKRFIYLTIVTLIFSNCNVMVKPIAKPIANSFGDIQKEAGIDSCEQALISLIIVKRFTENKFPDNIKELDYIDFKDTIDTNLLTEQERKEYNETLRQYKNEWLMPWKTSCKVSFDTVIMRPYSTDSLKLNWTKIYDIENSNKKVVSEKWTLKSESDSLTVPYFNDIKIEVIDPMGKVISTITANDK